GDDVQAIKAGILEIADILVVNKADRPGVENTVRALKAMLDLGHRFRTIRHHGQIMVQQDAPAEPNAPAYDFWQVPILKTVATAHEGIDAVADAIDQHRAYLRESGILAERERLRVESELAERLREALLRRLMADQPPGRLDDMIRRLLARELDPNGAVRELLDD
ncbi:MAG: methylmalonyl Co-A mutase-associated GTPase MeaB, partial [Chloroflexi bacterium]